MLGYPSVFEAADHVPEILSHGPVGLEGIDSRLIDDMVQKGQHEGEVPLLPEGEGWLLVEFGADSREQSHARRRRVHGRRCAATRPRRR